MQNVFIEYNPYKVNTIITVNGEEPKENSSLTKFLNQRFQMWVDQLPKVLDDEYNDNEYNITFHGTELDYQDLVAAIDNTKDNNLKFEIKKIAAKEFGDKEKAIINLFEKARKLPFEELQSPALEDAFKLAFNELVEVNVVATMSAGKSTLINALLGKKLMPSKNGACTATITKIQDDDDNTFKGKAYDVKKDETINYSFLDIETMKELNANEGVNEINVYGNIPFVSSEEVSLVLIDTPGPDNARDKSHRIITAKALDESSKMLVLFVMNGNNLHNEAQDEFLHKIADSMSLGGKQSRERFLFVINKMDTYNPEEDDIANETIPDTKKYLEDMGIENPNIFPASASVALNIRQYQNIHNKVEKQKQLKKFESAAKNLIDEEQLHLEKYPQLVHSCQDKIDNELKKAIEDDDILGQALVHSGIRGIEESIHMYVTKYSRPAKITNIVTTFRGALKSSQAFENTKMEITSQQDKLDEYKSVINKLNKKLTSQIENNKFRNNIDKLNIETDIEKKIRNLAQEVECELTKFFDGCPIEMEEDEAMKQMDKFRKLAIRKQSEFQIETDKLLYEDIQKKSQQLWNEYIDKINKISEEVRIDGFSIDLTSFVKNQFTLFNPDSILDQSIDTRIESHTEQKEKVVTKKKTGLDRLFDIWSWFDPYYSVTETYNVEVKEEVYFISREKMANSISGQIRKSLVEERERVKEFAKVQTDKIKKHFYKQCSHVDKFLVEKTKELNQAIKNSENAKKVQEEAKKRLEMLKEVERELEAILEI